MRRTFLILTVCMFAAMPKAMGANTDSKTVTASLRKELAAAKTPKDSIRILYDIFDLASRDDYMKLGTEIYTTAKRSGNIEAQLDIIRLVTAVVNDDESYNKILYELKRIPASEQQRETRLFIQMKQVSYKARNMSEEERQKEVTQLIAELEKDGKPDKYELMLRLFKVVEYLRQDASGEALETYIDQLIRMIDEEDFKLYALENLIYSEATNIYTSAGEQKKALKADRKLLEVIDGLQKKYDKMGRRYRNYDVSRFICYRRMLRNYEALTPGEAETLYAKILELGKANPDIAKDLETNPYTEAFHNMAIGQFVEAIPYLKQLYEKDQSVAMRKRVLELLMEASEKTGDEQTHAEAEKQYEEIEKEYERLNASTNYKMLKVRYDISALQKRNTLLELENKEKDLKTARSIMLIIIFVAVLLAIAFVVSLTNWGRYKKNAHKLTVIANHMTTERNHLRYRLIYDHDEDRGTLLNDKERWNQLVAKAKRSKLDLAVFMIQVIINDLLHIAMMGKANREKHIYPISVDSIMRRAALHAEECNNNGHKFDIKYPEDDFRINTDRDSLALILGHLLHGTSINTPTENPIELTYERTEDKLVFCITAKGWKDESQDAVVFDTLITIDEMVKMADSGMTVDRLIALLLASDMIVDTTFRGGTRVILMTPNDLLR